MHADQDDREGHGDGDLDHSEGNRGADRRLDAEEGDHTQAGVDHAGIQPPRHADAEQEGEGR